MSSGSDDARLYVPVRDCFQDDAEGTSFADIDLHFARLMQRLSGREDTGVLAASALVSRHTRQGHICIDLARHAGKALSGDKGMGLPHTCPGLGEWKRSLAASPVVGKPGEYRPLVLDGQRLYLWRYWSYEQTLAKALLDISRREVGLDAGSIREGIGLLFPGNDGTGVDWQMVAVLIALKGSLCILTGGPGTGKTTVVSRILALLLGQDPGLRIALAAPTGKAAQRLEEALGKTMQGLRARGIDVNASGLRATTIHRLLGMGPRAPRPRFHVDNPMPHDIVVVDEASMTSLGLMTRLVEALKPGARLILSGDRDQLDSVEPGRVLGDICGAGAGQAYSEKTCRLIREVLGYELEAGTPQGVSDCIVELKEAHRFAPESGIRRLSEAVRAGDGPGLAGMVRGGLGSEVRIREIATPRSLREALVPAVIEGYAPFLQALSVEERFSRFGAFRILSSLREGPFGVGALNRLVEGILAEKGLIRPGSVHYHGRPVLITANDYGLNLFNGDIGIVLHDEPGGELKCFFEGPGGSLRTVSCLRLPGHETAFAMTVHKSQGSEFSKVVLILPPGDSPVHSRELVYTGITRARERLDLWASPEVFMSAVMRRTDRVSGLRSLLVHSGSSLVGKETE